jgi:hypothetical protein
MKLGAKQELFARMEPLLFLYTQFLGYSIRGGDGFRDPRTHGEFGEKKGYGRKYSCHKLKLARDLNLAKDGIYLEGEAAQIAHEKIHDFWDLLGGAQRIAGDMNHYSLEHNGYR